VLALISTQERKEEESTYRLAAALYAFVCRISFGGGGGGRIWGVGLTRAWSLDFGGCCGVGIFLSVFLALSFFFVYCSIYLTFHTILWREIRYQK
jgi:hypothetical protein